MSGICGIAFRDRRTLLGADCLAAPLREMDAPGGEEASHVHLGSTVLGSRGFPGRLAGVARVEDGGSVLAVALHGSLFPRPGWLAEDGGDRLGLEGLLKLYRAKGTAALRDLRGEFALAIWDGREETLLLATDRFRVHPVFYYHDAEKLVFASRMRSLRAAPVPMRLSIDPEAVVQVLGSSIVPTPGTIFREVKKLPPGNVLSYSKGETSVAPYWDIDFRHPATAREAELARALRDTFSDSLSVRLAVDGDSDHVGTYLSGGVDSSTVTGVMTELVRKPVKSFSIGFDVARYDEMSYARLAASAFGARHVEYFVSPGDVHAAIPILLDAFDEPFANASAVPSYFCAKVAKEHGVGAMYAGDGGDELFAGNERYAEQRLFEYYHEIPRWLRDGALKPAVFAAAALTRGGPFLKAKKYILRAGTPYSERLSTYGFFNVVPMAEVLEDGLLDALGRGYDPYAHATAHFLRAPADGPLDRHLYLDLKVTISDNDILKVTRTSEAAGVTARYPFLDHRLAEFAATVPAGIKMRGRKLRTFFKGAYSNLLPAETRAKTKHGFGLPVHIWLRDHPPLNEMMRDLVLSERSVQRGYFRKDTLRTLVDRHRDDPTSFYGTILWNLMVLEMWHRRYW
jgi:asparagine synthase (glutamine-hydrolysing)